MLVKLRIVVFLTLFFLFSPTVVSATNYYVSNTGDDLNLGTQAQPWKTIQRSTQTPVAAGDTIYVRGGTYIVLNDTLPIRISRSGSAGNYISYKAYGIDDAGIPDETPIIYGNYPDYMDQVFAGFDVINSASYIHIEGFAIEGFRAGLSCKASSHHVTFKNNILRYNSSSGISSSNSGSPQSCDYMLIVGNDIHDNGYFRDGTVANGQGLGWGSGISINTHAVPYIFGSNLNEFHTVIRNNRIYHNYDGTGGDTDAWTVADHTDGNGIILDLAGNLPPTLIENNLIFDNGGRGFHPLGARNVWFVGNTLYRNGFDPYFPGPHAEIMGRSAVYNALTLPLQNIHIINNLVVPRSVESGESNITYYPNFFDTSTGNPYPAVDPAEIHASYNIWYGGTWSPVYSTKGTNYIEIDPANVAYNTFFVNPSINPANANFDLLTGASAINAGTSNFDAPINASLQMTDYDGVTRPPNYDIGAYEGPDIALSPTPSCIKKTGGDADCNDIINLTDFITWKTEFLNPTGTPTADFDGNGVGLSDFMIWKNEYLGR